MNDPDADAPCPVEHPKRNGGRGSARWDQGRSSSSVICLWSGADATDNPILPIPAVAASSRSRFADLPHPTEPPERTIDMPFEC